MPIFTSNCVAPRRLRLEVSSICQLRCPSCPTATGAARSVIGCGVLAFDDFRRIVDDNPRIVRIELSNYGEIFLNPNLLAMMEYAYAHGVSLTADNGVNLNTVSDEVLEGLVRFRFNSLSCSIDGASAETYRLYRLRGDFDRVLDNIRKINELKHRYRSEHPRLTWQFVVMGHNEHEIAAARRLAHGLGMRFFAKLTWDQERFGVRDEDHVRHEMGCASREEFRALHGRDYMHDLCHALWDRPQVNWDGKILGCCRNFWGEFGGNAFAQGLREAINGERIRYARDMLLGRRDARPDVPCASCDIYLDMKATNRWLSRGPVRHMVRLGQYVVRRLG